MLENLEKFTNLKRDVSEINLDPLQRGGILTPVAREALVDGAMDTQYATLCRNAR
jgi:Sep-tRNA:Cys-tRNA synthetase